MNDGTMIRCDQVVAKLWEYLDQELDEATAAQVQQHLEVCGRCFPQYDFQRAYRAYLRQVQRESVPPELRHRIFEAILAEEASNGAGIPPQQPAREGGLAGFLRRLLG